MSDEDLTTKPTLEMLLEMMRGLRDEMRAGFALTERRFDAIEQRLDGIEHRLDSIEQRLDGIEQRVEKVEAQLDRVSSVVYETRADFRDLKKDLVSR